MTPEKTNRLGTKTIQYAIILVLVIAIAGSATYAVMSDTSIHGLTVRFYSVSRYCTDSTTAVLTFSFNQVVVYSSTSLETSLSPVHFTMSADGILIGTTSEQVYKFDTEQRV